MWEIVTNKITWMCIILISLIYSLMTIVRLGVKIKCNHKITRFEEIQGRDIEVCEVCGMSRDCGWPQPSDWGMVDLDQLNENLQTNTVKNNKV